MSYNLTIGANFRTGPVLPSVDRHYADLWHLAVALKIAGFPIAEWYPSAPSAKDSLLNPAFDNNCPSSTALAMAKTQANLTTDVRTLGVWNGKEGRGGAAFTATYTATPVPGYLSLITEDCPRLFEYDNVVTLAAAIIDIWNPMMVQIGPAGFDEASIFEDHPPVGWMLYLPFELTSRQVPEAAAVIPIVGKGNRNATGTILVSVKETFDLRNAGHVTQARAIQTRLVEQDLLPTLSDFADRF